MSSVKQLKRKYGETKFVKKAKKPYAGGQGKFLARQNRVLHLGMGPERKVIDTPAANYVCDTTGSVTFVNGCAQGTDFNNCVGRKYVNTAIQLEGLIVPADTTTATATKCRVMLIYDEQPNGAVPAITDILTASTSAAFMNLNNRDRFKVIADENVTIGGISDVATQAWAFGGPCNVSIYRKINLPTIRNGAATTAAITNYQTGSLLLVTIGSAAANAGGVFSGAVRVRFMDA